MKIPAFSPSFSGKHNGLVVMDNSKKRAGAITVRDMEWIKALLEELYSKKELKTFKQSKASVQILGTTPKNTDAIDITFHAYYRQAGGGPITFERHGNTAGFHPTTSPRQGLIWDEGKKYYRQKRYD